jgi:hypothetical protein
MLSGLVRRTSGAHLQPPQRLRSAPGAARAPGAAAQRDCRWGWTGVSGGGRVAPQRCPGGTASGRATGQAGGDSQKRRAQ